MFVLHKKTMFYNRQEESARLNRAISRERRQLIVVYGRRRCGKSRLLREHVRPGDVYYLASQSERAIQIGQLADELRPKFPLLDTVDTADWDRFFRFLNASAKERFTLVLDEFPFLVRAAPELPSVIQRLVDDRPKLNFDLILCGSSQQMMRGIVLSATAPLFGRADEIMQVQPLKAGWLLDHLPNSSPDDLIREYATWGGVPRYWELRSDYPNYPEAVKQLVLIPEGVLRGEPTRLLLDDIREPAGAISLLYLIASGVHRPSELGARLHKPATDLSRPLARLVELGYVERESPYGSGARNRKNNLYKVIDPFIRHYYRFVHPNLSALQSGRVDDLYAEMEPSLPIFVSVAFERLARQAVPWHPALKADFFYTGRWWGKGTDGRPLEIDVVAESRDKSKLLVGECKWSNVSAPDTLQEQLGEKAKRLPHYKGQEIVPVLVGRSFQHAPSCVHLTSEDVLKLLKR